MPTQDDFSPASLNALQSALTAELEGDVRFDKVLRTMYATDASVYQIIPTGVVLPHSAQDVVNTINICRHHGASITARGGGTSQAGQAIGPGVQLDFSKYMNRLLDLDVETRTVRVEPGIVLDELNAQLKPHGLHLPLDLSTASRATIGGMLANNSAGTRSIIYGKTIDYVQELQVVLADGSTVQMHPLDAAALDAKLAQPDLEGICYRTVQQLATENTEEIERRYPKILRRVGGYNLDEFVDPAPFNLARIMVGSEGTLGLTVAATLRLVPLPTARILCAVQFDDLLEAMEATPIILEHLPSTVELIDRFILDTTKGRIEFEPLRDFIVGDPGAVLLVEFFGEEAEQLSQKLDRLEQDLRGRNLGHHFHRAVPAAEQARIWELRKAALGLSMSQTGDAKSISFVEDTAVAPQHLRAYIERFQAVLAQYDTPAGFYAHASVGLLHIRPVINMKTSEGVDRFAAIAAAIADLVLEFGGALSGEHGDGLARAPFQEKMFGPTLYQAFCQIKDTFDPDGLLNPGKIVRAPSLTANLRFGADYKTPSFETKFDFSDFGGLLQATEQCSGVGACRKNLSGTMCPSYMATKDESASTRGRANALRLALTGQLGSNDLAHKELYPVLDLCLECKACKRECPTGVDMARLKSEFLHQYHRKHGAALRTHLLANAEKVARWGSHLAPLSNWLAGNSTTRWLNDKVLGLDRRRPHPSFAKTTFIDWCNKQEQNDTTTPDVVLFADTFNNFHEPHHLIAAARLARRFGAHPAVAPRVCCGRPLISKGFLDQAAQQAHSTTTALLPLVDKGQPIVFCEPSCYSAVRDDHPRLVDADLKEAAEKVAQACLLFDEWAATALDQNPNPPSFKSAPKKILVHGHCHQKALSGLNATSRLLSHIPSAEVLIPDNGCCGMAGSFGYEREHYTISQTIAAQRLLPAIAQLDPDHTVVASGFSCRHQIAHFSSFTPESPMTLLDALLDPAP